MTVSSFTVDCKKWYHPRDDQFRRVMTRDGKLSVIGFLALACGYRQSEIRCRRTADHVLWSTWAHRGRLKRNLWPRAIVDDNGRRTFLCSDICLVDADDDFASTERGRKRRLKQLFRKIGIVVTFKN